MTSNTSAEVQLEKTPVQWVPEIDPFYEVLLRARKLVSQWGGDLYFVYLPGGGRYVEKHVNAGRPAVLQAVNKAGVPVIDLHLVFKEQGDPLALFPLRIPHTLQRRRPSASGRGSVRIYLRRRLSFLLLRPI